MADTEENAQPGPETQNGELTKQEDAIPAASIEADEGQKVEEEAGQKTEAEEAPEVVADGGEDTKEEVQDEQPQATGEPAQDDAPQKSKEVDSDEDLGQVPSDAKAQKTKKKGTGKDKGDDKKGKKKKPKGKSAESLHKEDEDLEATQVMSSKTKPKGGKGKKGKGKKGKKSKSQEEGIQEQVEGAKPEQIQNLPEQEAEPPVADMSEKQMEEMLENYYKSTDDLEKSRKKRSKSKTSSLDVANKNASKSEQIRRSETAVKGKKNKRGSKDDKKIKEKLSETTVGSLNSSLKDGFDKTTERKQSAGSTKGNKRKTLPVVESDIKVTKLKSANAISYYKAGMGNPASRTFLFVPFV